MSYSRKIGDMTVHVCCASNPETTYAEYFEAIKNKIVTDGYVPETSFENLISMIILIFDCDDNYGEYDNETGLGGYGYQFSLEECFRFVEEQGGYREFDYCA